jgi:glucose/arabinose dehydrogenase/PKD repeat protein
MKTLSLLARVGLVLALFVAAVGAAPAQPAAPPAEGIQAVPAGFADELVANFSGAIAIAFTPDGRLLTGSQAGVLRVYNPSTGSLTATALDFTTQWPQRRICSDFERGLMGIAVDPNFASNNYVYLYYTAVVTPTAFTNCDSGAGRNSPNVVNRVSRFTFSGNTIVTTTEQILVDNIRSLNGNHNGGDLNFGKDGLLYIATGDSGTGGSLARSRNTLSGKILRVNSDGTPAAGNPTFGDSSQRRCGTPGPQNYGSNATNCQEIYSYGLRNPFRFAMDPTTSGNAVRFFINDVGQNTWEEVDDGIAGADYGWNVREGPCANGANCSPPTPINSGYTDPIDWYNHSTGCSYITAGAFVPAGLWPGYDGSFLFGDGGCGRVFRLVPLGGGSYARAGADFATGLSGIRHLEFGPYQSTQALYYSNGSAVRRIRLSNAAPTAVISANPTFGPSPLPVNFSGAGSSDPNGDPLTYEWNFGNGITATTTSATTTYTYTVAQPTVYTATLVVRDNIGLPSAPVSVTIYPGNTPPAPTIAQPITGTTFFVGQIIGLAGSATDPQSQATTLRWDVLLRHIDSANPGNSHTHSLLTVNGASGQFTAPAPEDFNATDLSHVEVHLTATDSLGLSATVTRTVQPVKATVTFNTQPTGLQLQVNERTVSHGTVLASWQGATINVSAAVQFSGGQWWILAPYTLSMPGSNTTSTATFAPAQRLYMPLIRK